MKRGKYDGYYDGVIAALDVIASQEGESSTIYAEVVSNCGPVEELRRAALRADVAAVHPSLFAEASSVR